MIYSTTTAALLWPRRGVIRFDAPASANRPGRHGLWQRALERRRLLSAELLLPWSDGALRERPRSCAAVPRDPGGGRAFPAGPRARGIPADGSAGANGRTDVAAITYAANPRKKGLDRVLAAWRTLSRSGLGGELMVAGASASEIERAGIAIGDEDGVRVLGRLPEADYRAVLRSARVFVCAPRREDYGLAQLEALADGCQLVTTAAPGPYAALPIARSLDGRLVGEDLVSGLRAALEDPLPDYRHRASEALVPFRRSEVDRLVASELLPRLAG